MSSMWQKAMVYLGLQDDEMEYEYTGYDDLDADSEPDQRPLSRAQRPSTQAQRPSAAQRPSDLRVADAPSVRTIPRSDEPAAFQRPAVVRTASPAKASVVLVEPKGFNDAQDIGEKFRHRQPVIVSLQGLSKDLQRRLIDFASGLTFALDGTMSRVADQVFLLTPSNVEVSEEDKSRLEAKGLFDRS